MIGNLELNFFLGIKNSFPEYAEQMRFYKKYYQILLVGKFPMKEKKLLLVGKPDSGKTSWFSPFEGIIPSKYISGVVRDGRFAGSMINNRTQVVFMDEWTSDSLSCEDAKRILQGGLMMLPQKHKAPTKFLYNGGFFITTNEYPNFGNEVDCEAIKKRLDIFETKPLLHKDNSVTGWLRLHCMDVFHYLAYVLRNESLFDCGNNTVDMSSGAVYNDFDFDPKELLKSNEAETDLMFSQSTNLEMVKTFYGNQLVPNEALDHAILESDVTDGTLYADLVVDHPDYDITSSIDDIAYMTKVYSILKVEWKEIALQLNERTYQIYKMRKRSDWKGADSVYDAWLISGIKERSAFKMRKFIENFPDAFDFRQDFYNATMLSDETSDDSSSQAESVHEDTDEKSNIKLFCPSNKCFTSIDLVSSDEEEEDDKGKIRFIVQKKCIEETIVIGSDDD